MSDSLSATAEPLGTFRIGRVIGRSFGLLFSNLPIFLALGLAPGLPALFLPFDQRGAVPLAMLPNLLISLAVLFFLFPFVQATILHASFQSMRDRPVSFGESFSVGLSRFLPILGTIACAGLMTMLGFFLLVVPGFMLMARYYAAVSACVVEQTGPLASLKRSAELTQGYRWRLFGLILLVAIVNVILGAIIGGIGIMASGIMGASILRFLVNGLALAFSAVLAAVTYHDLRVAREGVDTDRIAAVFD